MSEASMSASRRRGRWWIPPFVLAVLLIVAVVSGNTVLASYAVLAVANLEEGGFLILALALGLLALVAWLANLHKEVSLRIVLASLLVSIAAGCALLDVLLGSVIPDPDEVYRRQSADGTGTVIVYANSDYVQWELELRWGSGLTERRWDIGSVYDANSSVLSTPPRVRWLGRDSLRVSELPGGRQTVIELDPSSGRPHNTVGN